MSWFSINNLICIQNTAVESGTHIQGIGDVLLNNLR